MYEISISSTTTGLICQNRYINVSNSYSDLKTQIYADDITAHAGDIIRIPMNIVNNQGLMGYKIRFNYDPTVIEPINIISGEIFSGGLFENNIGSSEGSFDVLWIANENCYGDGELFYIEALVKSENPTEITVSYSQDDTLDENDDDVVLECKKIVINGSKSIIGINGTKIDYDKNLISGISTGLNSLENNINIIDGYEYRIDFSGSSIGTSSIVTLIKDNEVVDTYTVILYGDVNGDGWYDGQDAVLVSCLANGLLTKEQVGEAVYMAADCNHDGVIDELDIELLSQAGVLLSQINQSASQEELQTNSIYQEYISLIDQTPNDDVVDEPIESQPIDDDPQDNIQNNGFDFMAFLKMIFNFIYSFIFKIFATA